MNVVHYWVIGKKGGGYGKFLIISTIIFASVRKKNQKLPLQTSIAL